MESQITLELAAMFKGFKERCKENEALKTYFRDVKKWINQG